MSEFERTIAERAAWEVQRVINHWSSVPPEVLAERSAELADLEACRDRIALLAPVPGDSGEVAGLSERVRSVLAAHVLYGEEDGPFECGCKAVPPEDAWEDDFGELVWHQGHVSAATASDLTPPTEPAAPEAETFDRDLVRLLTAQREWSAETFGPAWTTATVRDRLQGLLDHIRKELVEVEADPSDVTEWVDVVILAFDGAWRAGHEPVAIVAALNTKYAKNRSRNWPDWRTSDPTKAIEHLTEPAAPEAETAPTEPACDLELQSDAPSPTDAGKWTAEEWNSRYRIGTAVYAWPGSMDEQPMLTHTRGKAWTLGDGTAVVAVEHRNGGIALSHVQVRPETAT